MPTAEFVSRHRFWIGLAIFAVAFACWPLDKRDVAGLLTKALPATPIGLGVGYLIAAVTVGIGAALITWTEGHRANKASGPSTLFCWIGFGLLLNPIGLVIVVVGVAALVANLRGTAQPIESNWKRGLLAGADIWIAALALVTLALTLREFAFFAVLALALAVRVVVRRTVSGS